MTQKEAIEKIESIAQKSTTFKIGETGQALAERLKGYNGEFEKIEGICRSSSKEIIDSWEADMIAHFISRRNNANDKTGSAGEMSEDSDIYFLYVVYNTK